MHGGCCFGNNVSLCTNNTGVVNPIDTPRHRGLWISFISYQCSTTFGFKAQGLPPHAIDESTATDNICMMYNICDLLHRASHTVNIARYPQHLPGFLRHVRGATP